jgi:hypothetical protein
MCKKVSESAKNVSESAKSYVVGTWGIVVSREFHYLCRILTDIITYKNI